MRIRQLLKSFEGIKERNRSRRSSSTIHGWFCKIFWKRNIGNDKDNGFINSFDQYIVKDKKTGVIDEVFTNESSGTTYAYVAVLVSNTYKDIKDDVYTTLSSDDDVTKACLVYYLKKYNFEVHDQDVFNNLKANNPEYLVSRPDLSESDD